VVGTLPIFLPASILLAYGLLHLYKFLTGRELLADAFDYVRLCSRTLKTWDRYCRNNPRQTTAVICLTTTPTRLPRIESTLKSLMYQTVAPRSIQLHIPAHSLREGRPYHIPEQLLELASVEVVSCEDFGPATKLIPALYTFSPDQLLIVVDDDTLYPPTMVEDFLRAQAIAPDTALALSGSIVPADLTDRPDTLWSILFEHAPTPLRASRSRIARRIDILRGCDGYLVQPRFFDRMALSDYTSAPSAAIWADDVWISVHCQAAKVVIPARRMPFYWVLDWFFFDRNALYRQNNRGNPEVWANTILYRHFAGSWPVHR
jgi:hypothetical protein